MEQEEEKGDRSVVDSPDPLLLSAETDEKLGGSLNSHDVMNNNTVPMETADLDPNDRVIDSRGSFYSEDGYIALEEFPGGEGSREVLDREIEGKENDDDEEGDILDEDEDDIDDAEKVLGDSKSSTDTSQLAQLIVDHVIGNVVTSFNVDESSSATEKEIEEALSSAPSVPHDDLKMEADQAEDEQEVEEEVIAAMATNRGQTEEIQNGDISTDFQITPNEKEERTGDESIETDNRAPTSNREVVITIYRGDDSGTAMSESVSEGEKLTEMPPPVKREDSIDMSDTECGSMGRLQKLPPLPDYPDFPQNYGNYKVCRSVSPGVKECVILETGEGIQCRKSRESGKTVITCTHRHNVEERDDSAEGHEALGIGMDQQEVAEKPYDEEVSEGQTVAEILQSMNFEIIDVKATVVTPPLSDESRSP